MNYEIEWIRIKDELPPENKIVLVTLKHDIAGTIVDIGYRRDCYTWDIEGEEYTTKDIYAWTYLPKPYVSPRDNYIYRFSARQFLGCICDVLLELDKNYFLETDIRGYNTNPIDEVFAKLVPLDIVPNFELSEMFEIIKKCSGGIYSCFDTSKSDKIRINIKNYNELNKNFFNKDLDVKVKEKIEKYNIKSLIGNNEALNLDI